MDGESRLNELLSRWEEAKRHGQSVAAEELCSGCPDLLPAVRRHIEALQRLAPFVAGTERYGPQPVPETRGLEMTREESGRLPAFPGYEIESELGRGGMGVVYLARQIALNRVVALKVIRGAELASAQERKRFHSEAELLAKLRHPNIIQIFEAGEKEGQPFFSMEWIDGGSLSDRLAGVPLPPRQAGELMETLARAMQAAHLAGIVHRDLKPANILFSTLGGVHPGETTAVGYSSPLSGQQSAVSGGIAKIADFGLAKQLGSEAQTQSGAVIGTPSYMAPEQAAGKVSEIDARTDVYALGALLYECLTGRPPFRAATALDTLMQVMSDEPVPVRSLQPGVPLDLETICRKCLEKAPARRYGSALELADDCAAFLAGKPIRARPAGPIESAVKWVKRRPLVASLLGTIAALVIAAVVSITGAYGIAVYERNEAREQEKETNRAKGLAEERGEKLAAALDASRRALARSLLVQANANGNEGNIAQALLNLEEVPEAQRSWEWHHLARRFAGGLFALRGHTGAVFAVASHPAGEKLATAGLDGRLILWNTRDGKLIRRLSGHGGAIWGAAWSGDGRLLASAGGDSALRLWDETGHLLRVLTIPTGRLTCTAFAPGGQIMAAGAGDGTVRLWNVSDGKPLPTLVAGPGIASLAFSPDGSLLACGVGEVFGPDDRPHGSVKLLAMPSGKVVRTLEGHTAWVRSVAFSPDGTLLASASLDSTIRLWDVTGRRLPQVLTGHDISGVSAVAFSPDGSRLASTGRDGTVRVWDVFESLPLRTFTGHIEGVLSVGFRPDGQELYSGGHDGAVRVWDLRGEGETFEPGTHLGKPGCLSTSADGRILAAAGNDGLVRLIAPARGQLLYPPIVKGAGLRSIALSADGSLLAVFSLPDKVEFWDVPTGRLRHGVRAPAAADGNIAMRPDGRRAALGGSDGVVRDWDTTGGGVLQELNGHKGRVQGTAYSPNSKRLATAGEDGKVLVRDSSTGKVLHTFILERGAASHLTFSRDSRYLAAAGSMPVVPIWDLETGKQVQSLEDGGIPSSSVAFTPDGKRIATTDRVKAVRIWDPVSGALLWSLKSRDVETVFVSGGEQLATGGDLGRLRIWDARPVPLPRSLTGRSARMMAITFSPDGSQAAAGSGDGALLVWRLDSGMLLRTFLPGWFQVVSVAFSADGKRLAAGGLEVPGKLARIGVWDLASGAVLHEWTADSPEVSSLAFSDDGSKLAWGDRDKRVTMRDLATGRKLLEGKGEGSATQVWFSRATQRVCAVFADGPPPAWNSQTGSPCPIGDADLAERPAPRYSPDGSRLAQLERNRVRLVELEVPTEEAAWRRAATAPDLAWHRAEARRHEAARRWGPASFHLGQAVREQFWDADLHTRRAAALMQFGRREEALRHAAHAVLLRIVR